MNFAQLRRQIQNESVDPKARLAILKSIKRQDDPEVLSILAYGCLSANPAIAGYCRIAIKQLPKERFHFLLNAIFSAEFGLSSKRLLQVMHELRGLEMMVYIVQQFGSGSPESENYRQLSQWLRDTGIIDKYLKTILTCPSAVGQKTLVALSRMDSNIPIHLANMAVSFPSEMKLKVLELFKYINQNSKVVMLLLRKLSNHPDADIRARAAYIVGRTLQNVTFMEHALKDPVPEVRISVLKSIATTAATPPAKIVNLLYTSLGDSDGGVRAKAAQVLYICRDPYGLSMLISMLNSAIPLERAYAARYLGELKEISAREKLNTLAQGDSNPTVRSICVNALKALDGQADLLTQQFEQLEGTMARYHLSMDGQTEHGLPENLDALEREVIEGMIQSMGVASDTAAQFLGIIDEIGLQGTALPFLLATIIDEDGRINTQKIANLDQVKDELGNIIEQLQSDEPKAVARVQGRLAKIQQNTVRTMLLSALDSKENLKSTIMAAKTLHELKHSSGTSRLTEMVSDSDRRRRIEAAKVLSTIADEFAAEQLKRLEHDSDQEVQKLAQAGLANVQSKLARNKVREVRLKIVATDVTQFPTVTLTLSARDTYNQPLTDLEVSDITLLEGSNLPIRPEIIKATQRSAAIAVSMVMDYSNSMTKEAIINTEEAIESFITKLDAADCAAIIKFAAAVAVTQELTAEKDSLVHAIQAKPNLPTQGTALYDSILRAMNQLDSAKDCVKIAVIMTDGADTASDSKYYDVTNRASHKDVAVYTIGLGDEVDAQTLLQLSHLTDGHYYPVADSDKLQDIYEAIFRSLRFYYQITYTSKSSQIDENSKNIELYVEYGRHKVKDAAVLSDVASL